MARITPACAGRTSRTAVPVIALIFPIAARIVVGHENRRDMPRVLEAQFGRYTQLERVAVLRRQRVAAEVECELGLRMQRGGHVEARVIVIRAFEADIASARVGADALQEGAKRHATPFADRAPAFNTDMPRNLRGLRQAAQTCEIPVALVGDEA